MEEDIQQNSTGQNPENTSTPLEETTQNEETSDRPNNRIAQIIEWLNWNHRSAQLVINFLLMVGTFLLFWKASTQSQAAEKAANAAKDAVEQYKEANKISASNSELSKRSFEITEKEGKARFTFDTSNTIKQIKELEKQFQIANKAMLVIGTAVDTMIQGNTLIHYTIQNAGKSMAIIDTIKGIAVLSPFDSLKSFKYGKFSRYARILLPSAQSVNMMSGRIPFTSKSIDSMRMHKAYYFFHGEIIYEDEVTDKKYIYRYYFKLDTTGDIIVMPIRNGIYDGGRK